MCVCVYVRNTLLALLLSGNVENPKIVLFLPSAVTTRSSIGLLQAPHMGIPILSWHRRQYNSF